MKKSRNIVFRLFRKSTQQLEPFCLTSQALYIGSPSYTSYPLCSILACSYSASTLSVRTVKGIEEFDLEDSEAASQIQHYISDAKYDIDRELDGTIKLLQEGIYFVACIFVDAWNTSRSRQGSLGSWGTFNGREKRILWIDSTNLYVGSSKSVRKACKIALDSIKRIVLEECCESGSYKMTVFIKEGVKGTESISLYSSDFFKIRECVLGLERLCFTEKSSYIGKPQSRTEMVFRKAMYMLKLCKEENNCRTFTEFFHKLQCRPVELDPEEIMDCENISEFNDTKKLSGQLLVSNVNPQSLVQEKKNRLRRQLSTYSYKSDNDQVPSETETADLRSTSGLFKAILSPIKMPVSVQVLRGSTLGENMPPQRSEVKILDSCCSDSVDCANIKKTGVINESSYIRAIEESSKAFTADHSFAAEKGGEATAPGLSEAETLIEPESGKDVPFETARFQKPPAIGNGSSRTEREFEHSLKNTVKNLMLEESKGSTLESCSEAIEKYAELLAKSRQSKDVMQSQNGQIGTLINKCEIQDTKIKKLKDDKKKLKSDYQAQIDTLRKELEATKQKAEEHRIKEEAQVKNNEELKQANIELKKKLQKLVNAVDNGGRYLRLDKENANPNTIQLACSQQCFQSPMKLQQVETSQSVISFRSPKAQIPRPTKKSEPIKKVTAAFKDIITTLLN